MNITVSEFNKLCSDFLPTLDDTESTERWYTEREQANDTLLKLSEFLFKEQFAKEARHKQYLELKAEFEPYL